jgi:hypothetical protein
MDCPDSAEPVATLEQAMLEGSQNLPHTYCAAKEYMGATIGEALAGSARPPGSTMGHRPEDGTAAGTARS